MVQNSPMALPPAVNETSVMDMMLPDVVAARGPDHNDIEAPMSPTQRIQAHRDKAAKQASESNARCHV